MKNLLLACIVLFAASCGGKNETTAQDPNFNPNGCGQTYNQFGTLTTATGCIPQQQRGQTSWLLKTKFRDFPSKVRVKINGVTVADECSSRRRRSLPGTVTRSRTGSEANILVPSFTTPLNGRVQVEIIKLGKKCFWWSSFYYQGNTRFTVGNVSTQRPAAIEVHLPQ